MVIIFMLATVHWKHVSPCSLKAIKFAANFPEGRIGLKDDSRKVV